MQIRVKSLSFRLTDAIRQHVERRIALALSIAGDSDSEQAIVSLSDLNGPKGGLDKSCRIMAVPRAIGAVFVEAVHSDLYQAVDQAAAKLRTILARRCARHREISRHLARKLRQANRFALN